MLEPGPMSSVQDLGRRGYARHGVSRCGAADQLALRTGNALLGNPEGAAAIEVALGGLKIKCLSRCALALTGADCGAKLKRQLSTQDAPFPINVNEVIMVQAGDELELGYAKDGAR